jgi:hypothetical protein
MSQMGTGGGGRKEGGQYVVFVRQSKMIEAILERVGRELL